MSIRFSSMENPYSNEVFDMTKTGLFPFVDDVFGWEDEFQKQRMRKDYKATWFKWVYDKGRKIGYVCFKPYDQSLHLHLIIVSEPYQGKGYGKQIMKAIHELARAEKRDITLSSFKHNLRAVHLYKSLNYEISEEEEHFLSFRLPLHKNM